MSTTVATPTYADYARAFQAERFVEYPVVDDFERRIGFSLGRSRLEDAARTLACPVKLHPPHWQHGRVLYAVAMKRLWKEWASVASPLLLDIGTAKGFSALCLRWAALDIGNGHVVSIDVVDPIARVRRNSIAELDGYKTVPEFLDPWPESREILLVGSESGPWLEAHPIIKPAVAFIDGKHTEAAVARDVRTLEQRQEPGDVLVFDDVQIPGVRAVVAALTGYAVEILDVLPHRRYAVAWKQ